MKEKRDSQYVKRSQKDYSLSFKLSVVREIESGEISLKGAQKKYGIQGNDTIRQWRIKYGSFDVDNVSSTQIMKSPQQKILELEQKLRLLARQNKFLEEQLLEIEEKAAILDKLIDLAEQEYIIPIRKNSCPDQSKKEAKKVRDQ